MPLRQTAESPLVQEGPACLCEATVGKVQAASRIALFNDVGAIEILECLNEEHRILDPQLLGGLAERWRVIRELLQYSHADPFEEAGLARGSHLCFRDDNFNGPVQ
jgi:hypothetical protein